MKEFSNFMIGRYWNDGDAKAAGGRETLAICWALLFVGVVMPAALTLEALLS